MIDVVRVVTILIFMIFVACGAYQIYIERRFERSNLTDIQHFIPRAVLVASIFQIVATATNLSTQLDYSPAILILSDLSYDAATLVSYGVLFVLVQLTLKNASLAANMVGEKDENRVERARIVLFALWLVLLSALITAQITKAVMDRVAYSSIYLLSLAAVMTIMIIIVLRFLLQLWRHLTTIDGSAGSSSSNVSITTKIKPFMVFMVLTCICGAAAAVLQIFKSATLLAMDLSAATDANVYFSARSGSFDMFGPVTIICFVIAFYYSWKTPSGKPKVSRASSLRSARTSTLNPSQLIAAAASLDATAGEGYNSNSTIDEKLEDEPRATDSGAVCTGAAAIAVPTPSTNASVSDDTAVIVVESSSD